MLKPLSPENKPDNKLRSFYLFDYSGPESEVACRLWRGRIRRVKCWYSWCDPHIRQI